MTDSEITYERDCLKQWAAIPRRKLTLPVARKWIAALEREVARVEASRDYHFDAKKTLWEERDALNAEVHALNVRLQQALAPKPLSARIRALFSP